MTLTPVNTEPTPQTNLRPLSEVCLEKALSISLLRDLRTQLVIEAELLPYPTRRMSAGAAVNWIESIRPEALSAPFSEKSEFSPRSRDLFNSLQEATASLEIIKAELLLKMRRPFSSDTNINPCPKPLAAMDFLVNAVRTEELRAVLGNDNVHEWDMLHLNICFLNDLGLAAFERSVSPEQLPALARGIALTIISSDDAQAPQTIRFMRKRDAESLAHLRSAAGGKQDALNSFLIEHFMLLAEMAMENACTLKFSESRGNARPQVVQSLSAGAGRMLSNFTYGMSRPFLMLCIDEPTAFRLEGSPKDALDRVERMLARAGLPTPAR